MSRGRASALTTALFLICAGGLAAQDARTEAELTPYPAEELAAIPIPHPDPDFPNIFYGSIPPFGGHAPVIVFVHGLAGNATDWWVRNGMFQAAYLAGYRTAYMSINQDNSRNSGSIAENAAALAVILPRIANHYGVGAFYVVGHSKGGADVQAAMMNPLIGGMVKALFTVSTPNLGTELADWAFGPGRPIAGPLGLLNDGVASLTTTNMAAFRENADPILKAMGVPVYTIEGDRFLTNPFTIPTGSILKDLVPSEKNDGFVTVPRGRLSADFAVDLSTLPTDHFHTNGVMSFPKIDARIRGLENTLAEFRKIATNGFHDQGGSDANAWAWSMKWFEGKLYVGTGRQQICVTLAANDAQTGSTSYAMAMLDDLCPPLNELPNTLAAEIWQYTPETTAWKRVFKSPETIPLGTDSNGNPRFTARDIGFRGMTIFTEANGEKALYVGGVTSGAIFNEFPPFETIGFPPPRLLRTLDGEHWAAAPQAPGTYLGDLGKPVPNQRRFNTFRSLTPYGNKLFATVGDYRGVGQIIASANPFAGNNSWFLAAPPIEEFPVWNLEVFNGFLYVTTGDAFISKDGYGVYKTTAQGAPPYTYIPIITNGGWQANSLFRSTQGMSFMVFKGQLYSGTNRPTELVRINPDDTWDLVVGEPRITPAGIKMPISGLGIGFGSWFNGHFWRMGSTGEELYLSTWDWSVGLKGITALDPLFGYEYGFDLFKTSDGIHWSAVTTTGLGDPYNYGGRSFEYVPELGDQGLFLGTARQRGGLQVFQSIERPAQSLASPQNVNALSRVISPDTAVISWPPVAGAVRYRVYRSLVQPLDQLLGTAFSFTVPGTDITVTLADIQAGALDSLCPVDFSDSTICSIVAEIKAMPPIGAPPAPGAIVLPMAFPQPFNLIAVTSETTFIEAAPSPLQSLYFVRAEDAQGHLSPPSNFVGAPSKASPLGVLTPPPIVTASMSPAPNLAGWSNADVTVSWTIATPKAGLASSPGCEPITIIAEGLTTVTCTATNSSGQTTVKSVTVRIDKTSPTIVGSRTPVANGFGWNNTNVTVNFTCSDSVSAIALCGASQVVQTEGTGQARSALAVDLAGNTAIAVVDGINIDKTAPVIVAGASPPPNGAGWNNTDVTVAFTATDDRSGVASVTAPVTLTGEGAGQVVHGTAFDKAGNSASTSGAVNIDKTAPEALLQLDTANGILIALGRDGLAGVPAVSVASSTPAAAGPQRETYQVPDRAGNVLTLTVIVSRTLNQLDARIETLQYNAAAPISPAPNQAKSAWLYAPNHSLSQIEQDFIDAPGANRIRSKFSASQNVTIIFQGSGAAQQVKMNGLHLLQLGTSAGTVFVQVN